MRPAYILRVSTPLTGYKVINYEVVFLTTPELLWERGEIYYSYSFTSKVKNLFHYWENDSVAGLALATQVLYN